MKPLNTLILTYWLIKPEGDLHTAQEMREYAQNGVTVATFHFGERKMLSMEARFDPGDSNATISAALYAVGNIKRAAKQICPECRVWDIKVWLNGEQVSSDKLMIF